MSILVERGAAWVELMDPEGHDINFGSPDDTMTESVAEALTAALEQSR